MFRIVLVNPEIPANTGNIIRLAANFGASVHLVSPLGFSLEDRLLKRAGLDYHDMVNLQVHDNMDTALADVDNTRCFAATGSGEICFTSLAYQPTDTFIFGCESTGLSAADIARFPQQQRLYIPMQPNNRSVNLSNAVAVIIMEAWRQTGFKGAAR